MVWWGVDIRCGGDPITHKRWKPTFGADQGRGLFCIAARPLRAQSSGCRLVFYWRLSTKCDRSLY